MAGRGPAGKDPATRARRNKPTTPETKLGAPKKAKQPPLPVLWLTKVVDGEPKRYRFAWPARTRTWWKKWGESPQAGSFTATDWDYLLDTALLHARYWQGETGVAGELRLRIAKFGATPEDRARLRMSFAEPDVGEQKPAPASGARSRFGDLRVVEGGQPAATG